MKGKRLQVKHGESDEGLIKLLAQGDDRAWEAFDRKFRPVIHASARRVLRAASSTVTPDDEQDVVQNVFLRLIADDFRLLRTFDERKASLPTWLAFVTRSAALRFLERSGPPTIPLERAAEPAVPLETVRHLPGVLPGVLSSREAQIVRLAAVEGLSVGQVAKGLGISRATVYVLKHRALKKLRAFFCREPRE